MRKLLVFAAATIAALGLLEVSLRVRLAAGGGSVGELAVSIRAMADELDRTTDAWDGDDGRRGAASERQIGHPYFGWYGSLRESKIPATAAFYRDKPEDVYEIMIVGGSVAGSIASAGGDDLAEVVLRDPRFEGLDVRVRTEARGAFKQPQQLNVVAYLLASGWRPDAIVNIDGFNELALANQNAREFDVHPNHPAFFLWGPVATAGTIDREALDLLLDLRSHQIEARELAASLERGITSYSATLLELLAREMRAVRGRFHAARDEHLRWVAAQDVVQSTAGPPFEQDLDSVVELAVRNWAESSRSLQAICDARSIYYLHVLQPTLHDQGSKPLTTSEIETSKASEAWIEGVHAGYSRLREEGALLRELGVNFVDGSMIFSQVEEPLYFDACHFKPDGAYLVGQWIGAAFLEHLPAD